MIDPFFRIQRLDETASTNEDAKAAAVLGEPEGLVIQAVRQIAGKGRQGRRWESPPGNLYVSLLLRPSCALVEAGRYTFVTSLAVYDVVRACLPEADVRIKWPNDVLVSGRKISGILLESGGSQDGQAEWLVIGAGINVQNHPGNVLYPTTSLHAQGANGVSVDDVLDRFLAAFLAWKKRLETEGFDGVRAAWQDRAVKGDILARTPNEDVAGTFEGVDENGCLVLKLADGRSRAIAAADVFFT